MTEEAELRLSPPRQVHVAGISIGVLAIRPDPGSREAVVGVYNPERQAPESHRVRPGDELRVAGRSLTVTDIVPGADGHVDLVVRWPGATS